MENNWIIKAAANAVENGGLVRIENPQIRERLDDVLLKAWQEIKSQVSKTRLVLEPENDPEIASGESSVLLRTLSFMLFDGEEPVCRTEIECYADHWMIDNEYFLNFDESADFEIIHELLGNTRLSGNPPTLMIFKNDPVNHYQIIFNAGWGEDWAAEDLSFLFESIRISIDTHNKMHELSLVQIKDAAWAEEFLSTAYEIYEAFS